MANQDGAGPRWLAIHEQINLTIRIALLAQDVGHDLAGIRQRQPAAGGKQLILGDVVSLSYDG
jgi:hypothetical protein